MELVCFTVANLGLQIDQLAAALHDVGHERLLHLGSSGVEERAAQCWNTSTLLNSGTKVWRYTMKRTIDGSTS